MPIPPRQLRRQHAMLEKFVGLYCRKHAHVAEGLCPQCDDLLRYARDRLAKCPHDPKPACKDCATHCYAPTYRRRIREVMKFSGMHFVKRGRLDWLVRYFLGR